VEIEVVAAEATRFAIFGCRGLRVIGCLLHTGEMQGKMVAVRRPVATDKKINQP
jgi:hypothetical protein